MHRQQYQDNDNPELITSIRRRINVSEQQSGKEPEQQMH